MDVNGLTWDVDQATRQLAEELGVAARQVRAAMELLDGGNTIPFIARYRKEATHGLDEVQLRAIDDGLSRSRELCQRKQTILKSIEEQGLLTDKLRQEILNCQDKQRLEDLYLPFKPKRRTRATVAREQGLEPLATLLLKQEPLPRARQELLAQYVSADRGVPDAETALRGACDIVAEVWSEQADVRAWLTERLLKEGELVSQVRRGKRDESSKFAAYFDHREPIRRVPSHRLLAMRRGEEEGELRVEAQIEPSIIIAELTARWLYNPQFAFHRELRETVVDCFDRLLFPSVTSAVMQQLKEQADAEAIGVFAKNLRELLLASPAGAQVTLGIDPGFRTGCKLAVVDATGKFVDNATIYPTAPKNDTVGAAKVLKELIARHRVTLVAIGNGTASRETDAFVTQTLKQDGVEVTKVIVSEAGASVYSASEIAVREYPDLDVTVRGAISIAHRLQDPLAELVKIDPKSIGVGQYQHDVNQSLLRKSLHAEVESCVNSVGVDVNSASVSLLSYVAGIGPKLAENIVEYRNQHGPFTSRKELGKVPKLGKKAFEQAAGFLRVRGGENPLDNSAVHPESYYVVEKMAAQLQLPPAQLVGNAPLVQRLIPRDFVDQQAGLLTVQDILQELAKPGRDPRKEFRVAKFSEAVQELKDLQPGMALEGTVTNVTRFGAFVDVGVHQDGLVHISQMADRFVEDPSDIVSVGDIVRVRVVEVDVERKRIALSMKQK
jgi:uncharacterized protein